MPSSFLVRSQFTDFDHFTESVEAWRLDFRQLDRGPFHADVVQLGSAVAQLGRARFGNRLHQRGDPPSGMRTIVIPTDDSQSFLWRGHQVNGTTLMVFPEGAELESFSGPEFGVFTYSIRSAAIDGLADTLEIPGLDRLTACVEVLQLPHRAMRFLQERAGEVITVAATAPTLARTPAMQTEIESRLPRQILLALAGAAGLAESSGPSRRGRAIRQAQEYLASHLGEPVKVGDLCRATGLSERTLRRAFREEFGLSPKSYLTALNLRGARDELQSETSATQKITEVANRWGFWHMGQFAADYRRQFGELPSETLGRPSGD